MSIKASRKLSYYLRHAEEAELKLHHEGWAWVASVLPLIDCTELELQQIVADDDKNRYEFGFNGLKIRARQGHSTSQVAMGFETQTPPDVLYHGTVATNVVSIMNQGLLPGARHYVHMSSDIDTATSVGSRRGKPVLFRVLAKEAHESGVTFLLSSNGVWLASSIPKRFLELV